MFDVGFTEMFLVLVIALVVIGPERLPAVAKKVGLFVRKARRVYQQVSREVQMELDSEELNKKLAENNILPEAQSIKKDLDDVKNEIEESLSDTPDSKK